MKAGYKHIVTMQFTVFNKVIPQSCLGKSLLHAMFGFTLPKLQSGAHLKKPPCPFTPVTDDCEWERLIAELYPGNVDDETDLSCDLMTDRQHEEVYETKFAARASYLMGKMK